MTAHRAAFTCSRTSRLAISLASAGLAAPAVNGGGWSLQTQHRDVGVQTQQIVCGCLICCTSCSDSESFSSPGFGPWSATATSEECEYANASSSLSSLLTGFAVLGTAVLDAQSIRSGGSLSGSSGIGDVSFDAKWTISAPTPAVVVASVAAACSGCVPPEPHPSASASLLGPAGPLFDLVVTDGESKSVAFAAVLAPGAYELLSHGHTHTSAAGGLGLNPIQSVEVVVRIFQPCAAGDINNDGFVDGADLGTLLSAWNTSSIVADLNVDGVVDGADLGLLLGSWGGCADSNQ